MYQVNPPSQTQEQEQLDPSIINLAKAIRQTETGNREVAGATGEMKSRYQFLPSTWRGYAKEVLGDENAPINLENENKVVYHKIKKWKEQGYNIGQIASIWNSGSPDHYDDDWRGFKNGVRYDTPAYATKVAKLYQEYKAQTPQYEVNPPTQAETGIEPPKPVDTQNQENEPLMNHLTKRTTDLSNAVSSAFSGDINPVSGVIQSVGAIAGGLNDTVNKVLEKTPVVGWALKGVEKVIGKGAERFFNTETGQSVAKSINEFNEKHPEMSKNIGAGFNILTAIPILKGLGKIGDIALNSTARVLARGAEKKVASTLEETALKSSYKNTTKFLKKEPKAFREMVSTRELPDVEGPIKLQRILPDIEDGKYSITEAKNTTWENINNLEDKIKDRIAGGLESRQNYGNVYLKYADPEYIVKEAMKGIPNSGVSPMSIVDAAKSLDPVNKLLWDKFLSGEASLLETNQLRSSLGRAIGSKAFDTPDVAFTKEIGKNLYSSLSSYIKKEVPTTESLFKEISKQFSFQRALDLIDNKKVIGGFLGKAITGAAVAGGEAAGNMIGIPLAGAGLSYTAGKFASKKTAGGITQKLLKRSEKPIVQGAKKKIGGLLGAALIQKEQKNIQPNP